MASLNNRECVDLIKRIVIAAPTDPALWTTHMNELVERCGKDTDSWVNIFNCMAGITTGLLVSIAEHEQMNIQTVVSELWSDEYAQMLDMDDEIERMHDAAGTTDTSTGTDFVDRSLGDGEVDGLE